MNNYTVIPHPGSGSGRVSRQGRLVLFANGDSAGVAALIGWARSAADKPTAEINSELARVCADNSAIGAFAVIVLDDMSATIVINGNLTVAATSGGVTNTLSAGTHVVASPTLIAHSTPGAVADVLLEVERGTVAADGFDIRSEGAPAGLSVMAPSAPRLASVIADAPSTQSGSGSKIGAPLGSAVGAPPVKVPGLLCSRSHFNDPRARFCVVCGISMHQASFVLVNDIRPPLGVLTISDGNFATLVRSAVIGRDPSEDELVSAGTHVGLPIDDITGTVSRSHAELRLDGWDVYVVDKNSTNGTFVWSAGHDDWERLSPNKPRLIGPGTHVSFGLVTAVFDSALQQK